ncbi:MAG: hypothetical protein WD100_06290, partial [Tistlia sp.]
MLDLLFEGWERPGIRRPFLFLLFFGLLFWLDLSAWTTGEGPFALFGVVPEEGLGEASALAARALPAALIAGFLILDFWLLSFLPLLWQIGLVWGQLLATFVLFVYAFDLDIPYIVER